MCNGSEIEQVTSQKFLGVKLDSQLNSTEHIDELCKKVSQRIATLKKIKRNLPLAEHKLYFNALIEPIMLYGSCVWTTATEENVKRVFKLQKRTARVILDADFSKRSAELFSRLDWLLLKNEVNLQKSSLIFRRIKNEQDCPSYITNLLPRNADTRSVTGASRYGMYNLACPRYNRETEGGGGRGGGRTFQVREVKL